MKNKEIFVTRQEGGDLPPEAYLKKELIEDISLFPDTVRPIVKKAAKNKWLSSEEDLIFSETRDKWWAEKYGFPFGIKSAREEVLLRKYAPPETIKKAYKIQTEFLNALKKGEGGKIAELKKKYETEYPDQLEGVEVLFGLNDFLLNQKSLDTKRKSPDYKREKDIFQDLTEYQFLLTHYIIQNSNNKKFLNKFWYIANKAGQETKMNKTVNNLRRGVLVQVAVYKLLESLGKKPQLSHPNEDAFNAIDLWAEKNVAVQIKFGKTVMEPHIIESEQLAFPWIKTKGGKYDEYYSTKYSIDAAHFRTKIKEYGEMINKKIKGYMLIIPHHKIDFVTGEPAPELIEFFKKKL